jgi:type VI secretion system protein ImpA
VDREDAFQRVVAAAEFLRRDDMYSPVPYLMLRALRWGELRAGGPELDPTALESPPSDLRQELKRQSLEGAWDGVLETAEKAMGLPCGRGWLDLQRYAVRACQELGSWYDPIANSILSELRALLADYPGLPEMTLMDDTATANRETRAWIAETLAPATPAEPSPPPPPAYDEEFQPEGEPPDANDLAVEALQAGRPEEALGILTREIAQVQSGRERFRRRFQLAQICLSSSREVIAYPILRDLAAEMERRHLEEWESAELLAQPLVLLHRCMTALGRTEEEKQEIYERICRLDPVQAMSCG